MMQHLLRIMMQGCRCDTLDECGKGIFRKAFSNVGVKSVAKVVNRRASPKSVLLPKNRQVQEKKQRQPA